MREGLLQLQAADLLGIEHIPVFVELVLQQPSDRLHPHRVVHHPRGQLEAVAEDELHRPILN